MMVTPLRCRTSADIAAPRMAVAQSDGDDGEFSSRISTFTRQLPIR